MGSYYGKFIPEDKGAKCSECHGIGTYVEHAFGLDHYFDCNQCMGKGYFKLPEYNPLTFRGFESPRLLNELKKTF